MKAVKSGHILVVDEADKAPTHVTCILKTLVESGEMILSGKILTEIKNIKFFFRSILKKKLCLFLDGRRIVPPSGSAENISSEKLIQMHPDFRLMVLGKKCSLKR